MNNIVFTPAGLLELLVQIEELQDYEVNIVETLDNRLQLTVGESVYEIQPSDSTPYEIEVDDQVIDEIEDINLSAYEDLADSGEIELDAQPIESGLLKEIIKTLAVGGMVRLAGKILK